MGQPHNQQNVPLFLIQRIAERIDSGRKLTNRDLLAMCGEAGIDALSTDPHLCHEVAETALNFLVATKYGKPLLSSDQPAVMSREILRPLQERLPTQSWRSSTQIAYQQFSTPAPISYLAAYLLSLTDNDSVLEPSCGTGCLAVWAKAVVASVITNELDPRRSQMARLLGFEPTRHDAEFIDDFLPETIVPNVVLMNPPFSSSGGRVERNQNMFGFRHVESALRRLADGGRFVVVLGEGGSMASAMGRWFWDSLRPGIRVTRSIGLPGREYYRNGTTVGITFILGRKSAVDEPHGDVQRSLHQSFDNIEDALNALESI
ncbi:MAG TPA: methyltransferase [Pyrinomonadaceae bacterium]|nr:methyltransferase [Pyrinomonadaceae bacterium]